MAAIANMKPVPGGGVYAPFSPKHLVRFNQMIEQEYQLCERKVWQLVDEAQEMGEHFTFDLRYERAFESLERSLRYFAEKQLLVDGERRLHQFYIYLKNSERMIELAQLHSGLNDDGQEVLSALLKVNRSKNEKNYAELVGTMFLLKDQLDHFLAERGLTKDGADEHPNEEDRNDIIAK